MFVVKKRWCLSWGRARCLCCRSYWSSWWCREEHVSGHPRPHRAGAPMYRGCSCRDPLGCSDAQERLHQKQSANPFVVGVCFVFVSVCFLLICNWTYLQDKEEDFDDQNARTTFWVEIKRYWEEHLKDQIVALDKGWSGLRIRVRCVYRPENLVLWETSNDYLDAFDGVCLRTASVEWNAPGKHGPHMANSFFFLTENELASMPSSDAFSPLLRNWRPHPPSSLVMPQVRACRFALDSGRGKK